MEERDLPSEKQKARFNKIVNYLGEKAVKKYFYKFYPSGKYTYMTKKQMQKMITGLDNKLPQKPIKGVYGFYK